eukprot:2243812-Rhodomonas_salina.1
MLPSIIQAQLPLAHLDLPIPAIKGHIALPAPYPMPGTELAYGASSLRAPYAMPGTDYVIPGTDMHAHVLRTAQYWRTRWSYRPARVLCGVRYSHSAYGGSRLRARYAVCANGTTTEAMLSTLVIKDLVYAPIFLRACYAMRGRVPLHPRGQLSATLSPYAFPYALSRTVLAYDAAPDVVYGATVPPMRCAVLT